MAELKMLRFPLGVTRMDKIRNEYTSVGQHSLERKHERQDSGGMDMYGGNMMGIFIIIKIILILIAIQL